MLSVIIPFTEDRYDDVAHLYHEYKRGFEATGLAFEMIYVLDGQFNEVLNVLKTLKGAGEKLKIVSLAKRFGAATALNVGFKSASGDVLVTLPPYQQVEVKDFPYLIEALADHDLVVGRRWPRVGSVFNRFQTKCYNFLVRLASNSPVHDLGCDVRAFKRRVIEEVYIYGDLHNFLAVLAYRHGFKVTEVNLTQSESDAFRRVYSVGIYVRKLLDILTIYFLVKFTKRPLRFFGVLGTSIASVGLIVTIYLVIERLVADIALANRPALLLSSLLIVLGIQLLAIGLIGEIVIFTHAKNLKDYTIDKVIN